MSSVAMQRKVPFENLDSPFKHPEPYEDVGISGLWSSKHFCAFISLEQMRDWFRDPDIRKELNCLGCKLVTYEVDSSYVLHGRYQVMFEKEKASEISREAIPVD